MCDNVLYFTARCITVRTSNSKHCESIEEEMITWSKATQFCDLWVNWCMYVCVLWTVRQDWEGGQNLFSFVLWKETKILACHVMWWKCAFVLTCAWEAHIVKGAPTPQLLFHYPNAKETRKH